MVETDKLVPILGAYVASFIKPSKVKIDDWTLPLHHRLTACVLLIMSVLVTCEQFFGEPILCMKNSQTADRVVNSFCWIEGTFTIPRAFDLRIGHEIAAPGVDQLEPEDLVITHKFYQFVWLILLVQSLSFSLPGAMWRSLEGGRLAHLVKELDQPVLKSEQRRQAQKILLEYLKQSRKLNNAYAIRYKLCELIALLNLVAQLLISTLIVSLSQQQSTQPSDLSASGLGSAITQLFPKLAKCTFYKFGSSGDVQKYDHLCLLPINIINEKLFVCLNAWFVLLAVLSLIQMLYTTMAFSVKPVRNFYCNSKFAHFVHLSLEKSTPRKFPINPVESVVKYGSYGDVFLLELLAKNVDMVNFSWVFVQYANFLND